MPAKGLKLLERGEKFDLLLVDLLMPGIDGIELIRQLRTQPATMETPIIMVSAVSEQERIAQAIAAGASDYIMKPLTKEILAMKLDWLGVEPG